MEHQKENFSKSIEKIKSELMAIGPMRPGNINEQFKDPEAKTGSYYQLNYTHKLKTKTEYVRKPMLEAMIAETQEYKKFKTLIDKWIEISIQASKHRVYKEKEALKNN